MATATMTSKGQITIPAEVRQRMGLGTGDRIAAAAGCTVVMTFDKAAAKAGMTLLA